MNEVERTTGEAKRMMKCRESAKAYIYIYRYTYVYKCTCTHLYMYICTYIYTFLHAYVYSWESLQDPKPVFACGVFWLNKSQTS